MRDKWLVLPTEEVGVGAARKSGPNSFLPLSDCAGASLRLLTHHLIRRTKRLLQQYLPSPDDVLAGLKVRYRVGSSATTYLSERPE